MQSGIIIHVTAGGEKRTEFFSQERIRFGSGKNNDLQILTESLENKGSWLELELDNGDYRIIRFNERLNLLLNGTPVHRFVPIRDGDTISLADGKVSLSFFAISGKSALIATNRDQTHVAHFIEEAAMESAYSPKRDEAKAFLREFLRELFHEVSWTTKLIILAIALGFISAIFYTAISVNRELTKSREQSEQQSEIIKKLEGQLVQTNDQLSQLDKSNKDMMKTVSLAPNLRVEYGNGICLIAGVYDLVDRRNGKTLRYPDPIANQPDPYEPAPTEDGSAPPPMQMGLTTEGNGTPVEYDFIGTGFHVGGGYIITNKHVLQPWDEDDLVKQLIRQSNGRARVKKLVVYFPNFPQAFPLRNQQLDSREDLAVGMIDPALVSPDIPVLPIDTDAESVAIGKTVVTMGYPSGPERLLAMVDDAEAKSISSRFGNSRQALINYLAQSRKIVPLTTQGAITDLDAKRIVHDAKTAEGGSGAPLFGQSGKVVGVNFGVFTQNNAANMAIPIRFAVELLKRTGWKSPEEIQKQAEAETAGNTPTATTQGNQP